MSGSVVAIVVLLCGADAWLGAEARVSVREYGAVGDGRHDDTAAIRRACRSKAPIVFFPPGEYLLTEPIVIDLAVVGTKQLVGTVGSRVVMAGPGPAFDLRGTHRGTAAPGTVRPEVRRTERFPVVRDLEITGRHPRAEGIRLSGTMQAVLMRLLLQQLHHGIRLVERNRNVIISACQIYDNSGVGIFLDNVNLHQIVITGSHISYNRAGGVVSRAGNVRNIQISGCDIEGNMADSSEPTANVLLDSRGGSVGEVAITGCTIQHDHRAPRSANIRFVGSAGEREKAADGPIREGHVVISGNVLSDTRVNIHVLEARGVVITGNTIWKGFDADILVERSTHVVVGPNNLDRNPRYDHGPNREARGGVIFRSSARCLLNGLHIDGVRGQPAIHLTDCRQIYVVGCAVYGTVPAMVVERSQSLIVRGLYCPEARTSSSLVRGLRLRQIAPGVFDGYVPGGSRKSEGRQAEPETRPQER